MTKGQLSRLMKRWTLLKALHQYYIDTHHFDQARAFKQAFRATNGLSENELDMYIDAYCAD